MSRLERLKRACLIEVAGKSSRAPYAQRVATLGWWRRSEGRSLSRVRLRFDAKHSSRPTSVSNFASSRCWSQTASRPPVHPLVLVAQAQSKCHRKMQPVEGRSSSCVSNQNGGASGFVLKTRRVRLKQARCSAALRVNPDDNFSVVVVRIVNGAADRIAFHLRSGKRLQQSFENNGVSLWIEPRFVGVRL